MHSAQSSLIDTMVVKLHDSSKYALATRVAWLFKQDEWPHSQASLSMIFLSVRSRSSVSAACPFIALLFSTIRELAMGTQSEVTRFPTACTDFEPSRFASYGRGDRKVHYTDAVRSPRHCGCGSHLPSCLSTTTSRQPSLTHPLNRQSSFSLVATLRNVIPYSSRSFQ